MTIQNEYYTISEDRLTAILAAVQQRMPDATRAEVRAICLDDWSEGQEHQDWLDTAPATEIAEWAVAILRDVRAVAEAEEPS